MEEAMLRSVRKFCNILSDASVCEAGWSSPKDVARIASYLSFDVMSQVCFGHESDMLDRKENHYLLEIISEGARCLNTVRCHRLIPKLC